MRAGIFLLISAALFAAETEKVTLPTSPADLERGKKLYEGSCLFCHGPTGSGGKGANLARLRLVRAGTDEELVSVIEKGIPGTEMPGAWHMVRNELLQVSAHVRALGRIEQKPWTGDAAKGKTLFFGKGGCTACHGVRDAGTMKGGVSGPELSAIGLSRSPAHLKNSMLQPAAELPENHRYLKATGADRKTITGRLLFEDLHDILLRDETGRNHSLSRARVKIEELKNYSPMPSYQGKLSDSELDDVVAYLLTLEVR
jgi:putative heme-binding domain-containing protein